VDRRLSRRRLLLGAGAAVAGTGLVGACHSAPKPGAATTKTIEMTWWGSTERHKRTQDALAAFGRHHPDLKVNTDFSGWSGYWDKLATRTAGGNPPDVIQMDYSYIVEYARRGSLRPLDDFVPGVIDLAGFPSDVLAGGKIDDKLYGVNAGINSFALFVNLTQLRALGFEPPAEGTTWADFALLTRKISKKAPSGVFPTEYAVYDGNALECWLRQRGKSLFTADGELGFGKPDLAEWIAYWEDLRKTRAAAPADLQATTTGDVQNTLLVRRKVLFDFASSNQLSAYASLLKDEIGLLMYPQGAAGSRPGQYLKPSMLMSMSTKTQHPKEAATLIDALLTDPEITAILGSERGIPPSTSVRGALKAKADPIERKTYEYIDFVSSRVGALPPPAPLGGAEVTGKDLMFAGQQVAFGKASIDQAVNRFFEDAARALKT
jgi:pectin-derived oligosaccharide transport system substrate-binding protein